jgi:hypothetical protein
MQFKSLIQENQLQTGIERLSRKLYRSKSEKERLEEMQLQLGEINCKKVNLRKQFMSRLITERAQSQANPTVFKDILNQLRNENGDKAAKIGQARKEWSGRLHVAISRIKEPFEMGQETARVNAESLSAIDRLIMVEEASHENLEFVRHRLQSDLKILKKKIDRLNQLKVQNDRNLRKIAHSNIQIRFKKVALEDVRYGTAAEPADFGRHHDQTTPNGCPHSGQYPRKTKARDGET